MSLDAPNSSRASSATSRRARSSGATTCADDRRGRVYELIWDDAEVNAWLICWSEDPDTGFHDHDHSAAAIAVIEAPSSRSGCASGATARSRSTAPGPTVTRPGDRHPPRPARRRRPGGLDPRLLAAAGAHRRLPRLGRRPARARGPGRRGGAARERRQRQYRRRAWSPSPLTRQPATSSPGCGGQRLPGARGRRLHARGHDDPRQRQPDPRRRPARRRGDPPHGPHPRPQRPRRLARRPEGDPRELGGGAHPRDRRPHPRRREGGRRQAPRLLAHGRRPRPTCACSPATGSAASRSSPRPGTPPATWPSWTPATAA